MSVIVHEPTLGDILKDAWKSKLYILGFGVLFFIIAVVLVYFMKPYYKAEAIISPSYLFDNLDSGDENGEGIGHIAGGGDLFVSYQQILTGSVLSKSIITDELKNIVEEDCLFNGCSNELNTWNFQELSDYIKNELKIEPVGQTVLKRISYSHPDKEKALFVLSLLHDKANELIKSRLQNDLEARIKYLKNSLNDDLHPDHKKAVVNMMMGQEYLMMLTKVEKYVGAKYIEPVYVSNKAVWPRKYIFIVVFVFVGMLFGYIVAGLHGQNSSVSEDDK